MMKIQMLALTPLLAATLLAAQAEVPGSPLARAFADWKLAAATTASGPESLAALRALRAEVAASEGGEGLADLAEEIDARLAALAPQDVREPAKPAPKRAEELVVAEAVVTAVRTGDQALLEQLGARAVPALSSLAVNADGTTIPRGQINPLHALLGLDLAAGLDAALVLMESGDVLKKGYAAATLEIPWAANGVEAAWLPIGETDWAFANESWNRIALAAFEEPALPIQNLSKWIDMLVARGKLPAALEDPVFEFLVDLPPIQVMPEAGRAYFVRLLAHPRSRVREMALYVLQASRDIEATYRLVEDPEVRIRVRLVSALGQHPIREYADRLSGAVREVPTPTKITDAFRRAVLKLSWDPERKIRWNAIVTAGRNALQQEEPLFSVDELRALLGRVETMELLTEAARQVRYLPAGERVPILLVALDRARTLADEGASLGDETASFLNLDRFGLSTGTDFWAIVEGLSERGLVDESVQVQTLYRCMGLIVAGETSGDRYIDWAARHGGPRSWHEAVQLRDPRGTVTLGPWLEHAGSAARATALRKLAEFQESTLTDLDDGRLPVAAPDLIALARDGAAMGTARRWAGRELAVQHPGAIDSDAIAALVTAYAESGWGAVRSLLSRLEPAAKQTEFLRELIASPGTDEAQLLHFNISPLLDESLVEPVIARFPPESWASTGGSHLIASAVATLVQATRESFDPRLEFANVPDSRLQETLARAIGERRAPALLPLLDRVLANSTPGYDAWKNAVQAASGYFNDDAAALLLRSAREATDAGARQFAMDALKQMTDWRDAAAAWARSANAAAKREVAIAELVALIEDAAQPVEVRAEALRGLGLLDAAEELPRLVRALTSTETPIAAAARAALDRMNGD